MNVATVAQGIDVPWGERKRSQSQILQGLQPMLANQTGAQVFAFQLPSLPAVA